MSGMMRPRFYYNKHVNKHCATLWVCTRGTNVTELSGASPKTFDLSVASAPGTRSAMQGPVQASRRCLRYGEVGRKGKKNGQNGMVGSGRIAAKPPQVAPSRRRSSIIRQIVRTFATFTFLTSFQKSQLPRFWTDHLGNTLSVHESTT